MILAIESTCDETGAAVVIRDGERVKVLSDVKATSADMHVKYGGIVPEVAAREQVKVAIPVVVEALEKAGVKGEELEAVAVAYGPGLMGSLLIGVETAKALALAWGKPLIPVDHMRAHVLANWINDEVPELPAVALVVSGGHTDLYLIKKIDEWEWLGGTRDDAAGECFDKCARALGLPYPGGPSIEKAAGEADGSVKVERLPRPMLNQDNLDMSFSGVKSSLVSLAEKGLNDKEVATYAKEVNETIAEVLVKKTMKAVEIYQPKSVLLAGGVAASSLLREKFRSQITDHGVKMFMPEFKYCTDNAGMIGAAAVFQKGVDPLSVEAEVGLNVVESY